MEKKKESPYYFESARAMLSSSSKPLHHSHKRITETPLLPSI